MLTAHSYGKSGVRLVKVVRDGHWHVLHDLTLDISLAGDFSVAYVEGDNSTTLPTDTMRMTSYVIAQEVPLDEIEVYAEALLRRLLQSATAATEARVDVVEHHWDRLLVDGSEHAHAFRSRPVTSTCTVVVHRDGPVEITSGLDGLVLLKTTGSSYSGFLADDNTVLAETEDRIMATSVTGTWMWNSRPASYATARDRIQRAFEEAFARLHSRAVQQTLHAMATAALEAVPELEQVSLTLPNRHHIPVDMGAIGRENPNEVFVVLDRPFGLITGTVRRE